MKRTNLFLLVFLFVFVGCESADKNSISNDQINVDLIDNPATASGEGGEQKLPEFEFEEVSIDFGQISQGEKIKRTFYFENVGNAPLIISNAEGSCGCTVPLWPRDPIAPGEEEEIEVVFDSNGKQGKLNKTITLTANTIPNTFVISIRGEVLVPKKNKN